jgi:peptidoglycan biosynthesis protein MviN/MurJ (putative lipid II flippase)
MMSITLVRRGAYNPSREAMTRVAKLLFASVVTAVLLSLAAAFRPEIQAVFHRKEIAVAATVLWGAAIYVGLLFALQAVTLDEIRGALRRRPAAKEASPKGAR